MKKIKLSIIVPCYNEEKRFKTGFEHFQSFLRKSKFGCELILVNDGSLDTTLKLMKLYSDKRGNTKIVSYGQNKGKGFAISKGVEKARGEIILFSDIDHSVDVSTVNSFFKYFKDADVVIGSRRLKNSKLVKRQKPLREFLGKCFTLLVKILIDPQIKDATCGFKAFKSDSAKKLFNKISIYSWAFDAEILFLCKKYKMNVAQAPVEWSDAKGSKVSITKDIASSLFGLIQIRLNDINNKY
jgi:dolichyl-phosphate beta-glucosyltransferase